MEVIVYLFHFFTPPLYLFHSTAEARREKLTSASLPSIRTKAFTPKRVFATPPVKLCLSIFIFKWYSTNAVQISNATYTYGHNFICADRMRNYFMYENKRRNKFVIEDPKLFATDRNCVIC